MDEVRGDTGCGLRVRGGRGSERAGGAACREGEGVRGGGAPGVTATCGRRRGAPGARCSLFQPTPSVCSSMLPPLGAAAGGLPGVNRLALLAPGRCAGGARVARARLLRSKKIAREPGLRCAPLSLPPPGPALPATGGAARPLGLVSGCHGPGCTWGREWGGDAGEDLRPAALGAASLDSRSSQSSFPHSLLFISPFPSFFFFLVSGNLSASPSGLWSLSLNLGDKLDRSPCLT